MRRCTETMPFGPAHIFRNDLEALEAENNALRIRKGAPPRPADYWEQQGFKSWGQAMEWLKMVNKKLRQLPDCPSPTVARRFQSYEILGGTE